MNSLDILLPFGLLAAAIGRRPVARLQAPALATLLARTRFGKNALRTHSFNEFSRTLPHETWSAQRFGLNPELPAESLAELQADTSPPLAASALRSFGLAADTGFWFVIQPVHIHIARDHLVLTDLRQLQLAEPEARRLFEVARALFEQDGRQLLYGNPSTWFARADDWSELQTATPDAACGRSIDIWTPKGDGERQWRKLQNEVQMEWFAHPVNEERQARGAKPVNSIWLWGGAPASLAARANGYQCGLQSARRDGRLSPVGRDAAAGWQRRTGARRSPRAAACWCLMRCWKRRWPTTGRIGWNACTRWNRTGSGRCCERCKPVNSSS